jgi:hypothetical protein
LSRRDVTASFWAGFAPGRASSKFDHVIAAVSPNLFLKPIAACGLRLGDPALRPPDVRMSNSALERFNCQGPACREPRRRFQAGEQGTRASGGEGGIRTPGTVTRTPHFECGAFNHSATSPRRRARKCQLALCKQGALTKQERAGGTFPGGPCQSSQRYAGKGSIEAHHHRSLRPVVSASLQCRRPRGSALARQPLGRRSEPGVAPGSADAYSGL